MNAAAMDLESLCREVAERAKAASRQLVAVPTTAKNAWLTATAAALEAGSAEILAANARDVTAAPEFGLNAAAIDRLKLTESRITSAADGLRQVAALPDPVGEVREGGVRPNGLQVLKVGVPLGVVLFIYESRPNVTRRRRCAMRQERQRRHPARRQGSHSLEHRDPPHHRREPRVLRPARGRGATRAHDRPRSGGAPAETRRPDRPGHPRAAASP